MEVQNLLSELDECSTNCLYSSFTVRGYGSESANLAGVVALAAGPFVDHSTTEDSSVNDTSSKDCAAGDSSAGKTFFSDMVYIKPDHTLGVAIQHDQLDNHSLSRGGCEFQYRIVVQDYQNLCIGSARTY
jgi:hypothetical protein